MSPQLRQVATYRTADVWLEVLGLGGGSRLLRSGNFVIGQTSNNGHADSISERKVAALLVCFTSYLAEARVCGKGARTAYSVRS